MKENNIKLKVLRFECYRRWKKIIENCDVSVTGGRKKKP
jgi:hypothetical protein